MHPRAGVVTRSGELKYSREYIQNLSRELNAQMDKLNAALMRIEEQFKLQLPTGRGRVSLGPGRHLAARDGALFVDVMPRGKKSYEIPLMKAPKQDRMDAGLVLADLWVACGGTLKQPLEDDDDGGG